MILSKKIVKVFVFGLIFVFLLCVSVDMASALSDAGGGDWKYYKEITVKDNSGKTLTDFQVLVELNPSNFPANAKSDGSDLRFEDASGKELNYWIEDWDSGAKEAKIWVKVPSIPANGETKIKMYYGNEKASAVSDGDKVFEFFDDFDSGKLDKWVIRSGDWSIENGELAGRGTKSKRDTITTVREFPVDRVVEVDVKHITLGLHSHSGIILGNTNPSDGSNGGNDCIRILFFDKGDYMRLDICGYGLEEQHKAPIEAQTGIWNHIKYQRLGKNAETNYKVWVNGEQKFDVSETLDTSTWKYFGLWVYLDGYAHFDNVRIRKYTSPEPTFSLSPEVSATAPTPPATPTPPSREPTPTPTQTPTPIPVPVPTLTAAHVEGGGGASQTPTSEYATPALRPMPEQTATPVPTPVPTAVPTSTPEETPTPTPSPSATIPPLYLIGAAAVIAVILIAGIGISRKGKRGELKKPKPPTGLPKPKPEPAKQEPIIKETPPPISPSLTIERAIYDPCKRDFVEERLSRMKEWINRYDPGAYWFAASLQNNSDTIIEEWGVELETSSALKIEEAKIEGIEIEIPHEAHLGAFKISVPKEYGIVIPKGGAQRVYFKLRADKLKTTYEISGVFKSAITGDVPIRPKEFKYLCDAGSLKGAILEHPDVALEYVEMQINRYSYSPAEMSVIVKGLSIISNIGRLCTSRYPKRADVGSEVEKLKGYLKNVEDKLVGQSYNDFENLVREMDAVLFKKTVVATIPEYYAERIKMKCSAFPDELLAKLQRQSIERGG